MAAPAGTHSSLRKKSGYFSWGGESIIDTAAFLFSKSGWNPLAYGFLTLTVHPAQQSWRNSSDRSARSPHWPYENVVVTGIRPYRRRQFRMAVCRNSSGLSELLHPDISFDRLFWLSSVFFRRYPSKCTLHSPCRVLKGTINQAVSLRSFRHLEYFCECLSVIDHLATDDRNNLCQSI